MLSSLLLSAQNEVVVSGTVTDERGESLLYATVYIEGTNVGVSTNEYGFFSIEIPDKSKRIIVSYVGYETFFIDPSKDDVKGLMLKLSPQANDLGAVEIKVEKSQVEEKHNSTQMSSIHIPIKKITALPSIGGETDVIKVMQLMPGVQKGGEGGTSMFVRGGDADQNLVILDEATVYNIGHLFGFFSVFNPDAIKDMTLIKGAFPSNYGGRLSAVLDIRMSEGADDKIHGSGGIGLLSSRLMLNGPVNKKSSFMISGRRTYIDQVLKLAKQNVPYYFYDLNVKYNYIFSDKDRLFVSGYYGNDVLKINEEVDSEDSTSQSSSPFNFGFNLGNYTTTLRWNHIYHEKLFSNVSLIYTNFNYDIRGSFLENSLLIQSKVQDIGAKWDLDNYLNTKHRLKYGVSLINHGFRPNVVSAAGLVSEILDDREGDLMNTLETGVYGLSEYDFTDKLKVNSGMRISGSAVKGRYFAGLEPRLAGRYKLDNKNVLKASYSRMTQYMHKVSSSTVALPTDLWYPVTKIVKPQTSDQVAIGYSRFFKKIATNLTVEGYYKWMNNLTEYREGANLVLNDNFEGELLQGKGESWGAEFMMKKDEGKLTGWLSYTISWANRQFDDLNGGNTFFAKYDRRHNVNFVMTYELSKKWTFSAVWVYSTGSRFTPQIGQYLMPDATNSQLEIIPIYADKNSVQMSPSHRLDINFVRNSKEGRKFQGQWHFGAYNVYNRATPYRIDVVPSATGYSYSQPGLFGFIPSIAYNFKF